MHGQACWPPVLTTEPEILGYLTDTNKRSYSRDIGRSFTLGGNIYYLFGDTFCKNDFGEFVGLVSNTCSIVTDVRRPLESSYQCIDHKGVVKPLLNLTEKEQQYQKDNDGQRITLWPFSGVVEIEYGVGLMWYEKGIDRQHENQPRPYKVVGIGVAVITADKQTQQLHVTRSDHMLFTADEPRYGSVSTLLGEDDRIYLYGHIPGSCKIAVAKVHKSCAKNKHSYQCWDGSNWSAVSAHAPEPLFEDLPQGAVFRSRLFGPGKPYVFVGVSKWADSKIRIGCASTPQGPWHIEPVAQAKGLKYATGFMYCIYPHPWALQDDDATLMVTWSEQWPGGVVAGKLRFEKGDKANKDEL